MTEINFKTAFEQMTDHPHPRHWQEELAASTICRDQLIRIPTGLGKTEGVLAAWSFHRLNRLGDEWPRRLIWCLPMRVLVQQTVEVACELVKRLPEANRPTVHVAMGGEDAGEWFLKPERPAIIIGTQDMLLSRALNRGYASPRGRWPSEFGLLNHDALWVMDEVQLMDVGLATSAQLQAYRDEDRSKGIKPCHSWWMSATLQQNWLHTVDTQPYHGRWITEPCKVDQAQRAGGLWDIQKSLALRSIAEDDHDVLAQLALDEHAKLPDGPFGRITLIVCNTVERACATFDAIREKGRNKELELVHSRFRPEERKYWRTKFLSKSECTVGVDRIIVATQVVEAGVDISAGLLITDRAPWPSLVQRFGRCARYGGTGTVIVIDRGSDDSDLLPYAKAETECAWAALQSNVTDGVGIAALERYEESLPDAARESLYPYTPPHLLLRREFDELFDTTPDLTGADLDISRFIRTGDERDLQVFWLDIPKPKKGERAPEPPDNYQPDRRELCSVPFLRARDWLCEKGSSRLKPKRRAWVWDWIDGEWIIATREMLVPGRMVCVSSDSGGYRIDRGFDADSPAFVPTVSMPQSKKDDPDNEQNGEVKGDDWKTIATHTREVAETLDAVSEVLSLSDALRDLLQDAALWHDWGKSHPAFQGCMRDVVRPDRIDLAKAPKPAWGKKHRYKYLDDSETRPALRHELASALGLARARNC